MAGKEKGQAAERVGAINWAKLFELIKLLLELLPKDDADKLAPKFAAAAASGDPQKVADCCTHEEACYAALQAAAASLQAATVCYSQCRADHDNPTPPTPPPAT